MHRLYGSTSFGVIHRGKRTLRKQLDIGPAIFFFWGGMEPRGVECGEGYPSPLGSDLGTGVPEKKMLVRQKSERSTTSLFITCVGYNYDKT